MDETSATETKEIEIRIASSDDAAVVREIYRPYIESTSVSFETEVPSLDEVRTRISDRLPVYPWLIAELDGQAVGYAYAGQFAARAAYRWSVESSLYVHEGQARKGIGRALYGALLPILMRQGFRMVYAGIALPNPPSVGLHESLGFMEVANFPNAGHKFDAWHAVGWWALDLHSQPPPSDSSKHASERTELAEPTPYSKLDRIV